MLFNKIIRQNGQSLIEVLVALSVAILVLGALVILVLTSLKNAQFAQNQAKATKYAQETMEKIKSLKDRDELINLTGQPNITFKTFLTGTSCSSSPCCFNFISGQLTQVSYSISTGCLTETLSDSQFKRQIIFTTAPAVINPKTLSVKVTWIDATGNHESNLETILADY